MVLIIKDYKSVSKILPNSLVLGDCLEVMKLIPDESVDFVLCDLPYGNTACSWDTVLPFNVLWQEYERIIKPLGTFALFGTEPFASFLRLSNIKLYKYDWIYEKTMASGFLNAKNKPLRAHENICIFSKGTTANGSKKRMLYNPQMEEGEPYRKIQKNDPRVGYVDRGTRKEWVGISENKGTRYPRTVIKFSNNNHGSLHPTQKPIPLCEYMVRTYTVVGDVVLDNTMGSGSSIAAAKNLNRQFIGIELDENYFDISVKELESHDG